MSVRREWNTLHSLALLLALSFSSSSTCSGWEDGWGGQGVAEGAGGGMVLPLGGGSWAIVWVLKQDDENGWRGGCWRHINRGSRRPPVWDRSWIYIALLARQGQKWDTLVRRAPVRDIISRFWRDISVGRESPVRQSGAGAEDSSERGERGRGSAGRFRSQQPPYLVSCHSLTVVLGSCGWFWD